MLSKGNILGLICMILVMFLMVSLSYSDISCSYPPMYINMDIANCPSLLEKFSCEDMMKNDCPTISFRCLTRDSNSTTVSTPSDIITLFKNEECWSYANQQGNIIDFLNAYQDCDCYKTEIPSEYHWGCAETSTDGVVEETEMCCAKCSPSLVCFDSTGAPLEDNTKCKDLDLPDVDCESLNPTECTSGSYTLQCRNSNNSTATPGKCYCQENTSCAEALFMGNITYVCVDSFGTSVDLEKCVDESHPLEVLTQGFSCVNEKTCLLTQSCAQYDPKTRKWAKRECCSDKCLNIDTRFCFSGDDIIPDFYCPQPFITEVKCQASESCYEWGCLDEENKFVAKKEGTCQCPNDCSFYGNIPMACRTTQTQLFVSPSLCGQTSTSLTCAPDPVQCGLKYDLKCTIGDEWVPCECNSLQQNGQCHNNTLPVTCYDLNTNEPTNPANCAGLTVNGVPAGGHFTCNEPNFCITSVVCTANDSSDHHFEGPCNCDKFLHTLATATDTNFTVCREESSFTLIPLCINAITHETLDSIHCNLPEDQPLLKCGCQSSALLPQWQCYAWANGIAVQVPCTNVCDRALSFVANSTQACTQGVKVEYRCMKESVVVPETHCTEPRPLPADNICKDPKKCNYNWMCKTEINGSSISVPCNSLKEYCPRYRSAYPCDDLQFIRYCVDAADPSTQVFDTLCPIWDQTDFFSFIEAACPKREGCVEDGKKFEWKCYTYDITENIVQTSCKCDLSCLDRKIWPECVDVNNFDAIYPPSYCDQTTKPHNGIFCPANLPFEQCNENLKCTYLCADKQNPTEFFPCEWYQVYCEKMTQIRCGQQSIIAQCGFYEANGNIIINDEVASCCKDAGLTFPWGTDSNVWNCEKYQYFEDIKIRPNKTASFNLQATRITPETGCKYEYKCKHPATGEIVNCDCKTMGHYPVTNPDGTITWTRYCEQFQIYPQCYQVDLNTNLYHPQSNPQPCIDAGLTAPPSINCGNEDCQARFEWLCVDNLLGVGNSSSTFVPCSQACSIIGAQNQHCEDFYIDARCFKYDYITNTRGEVFNEMECYQTLGNPFFHQVYSWDICPGNAKYCSESQYEYRCIIDNNPFWSVPCQSSCSDLLSLLSPWPYSHRRPCDIVMSPQCYDVYTNQPVPSSFCDAQVGIIVIPSLKCNNCTDIPKYNLQCFINGDLSRPTSCDALCDITRSCESYTKQAVCYASYQSSVGTHTVPISNCEQELDSLIASGYDINGQFLCRANAWSKLCAVHWMCNATFTDGTAQLIECDPKDICSLQLPVAVPANSSVLTLLAKSGAQYKDDKIRVPIRDPCKQWTTTAVCVQSLNGIDTPVSNSYCINAGLPSPTPNGPLDCPTTLPVGCSRKYEWRCSNILNTELEQGITAHYSCWLPKCPKILCRDDFYISAQCYEVLTSPAGTIYNLAASSLCDWSSYPIQNHWGSPASLFCEKNCPISPLLCLNGAINPPGCNVWLIDDINVGIRGNTTTLVPGANITMTWAHNQHFGTAVNCTAMATIVTDAIPYGVIAAQIDLASEFTAIRAPVIQSRPFQGEAEASVTYHATVQINNCGNLTTAPVFFDLSTPWCATVKCASGFICDEKQHKCVCEKYDRYGENCDQSYADYHVTECKKRHMVFNFASEECECPPKTIFNQASGICEDDGTSCDISAIVCQNDGKIDRKNCVCNCNSGFFGQQCECVENYFTIALNSKPVNYDEFAKVWEEVVMQYIRNEFGYNINAESLLSLYYIEYDEKTGEFKIEIKFKSCNPREIIGFESALAKFREYFSTMNTQGTVGTQKTPSALASSDVIIDAGGIVRISEAQNTSTYITAHQNNNAAIITNSFAFIAAIAAAIIL